VTHGCIRPYYSASLKDAGGPHSHKAAVRDVDGGRMDGFVRVAALARIGTPKCGEDLLDPTCTINPEQPDVASYHDWREIPNYWRWASAYALQDHLFSGEDSWSLPNHLDMVSGWSAACTSPTDPMSCRSWIGVRPR